MKLKQLILICMVSIPLFGNAQDLTDWQVGVNLSPFIFSRINSDYKPEKAKQDFPNGFGFGLTIEKNWNEHWGIKTGVEYSTQNQKYDDYPLTGNIYSSTVDADFKYYKIPITVQYLYSIKENLYLIFNQGFQISFLNDYKTIIEDESEYITIRPDFYNFYHRPTDTNYPQTNYGWIYEKQTYGITGSIGLKGFFSEKFSYSTNLRYQYDLTSSDSENGFFSENNNTKNFCLGLELGIQYHFSIDDRFDSSPHKL